MDLAFNARSEKRPFIYRQNPDHAHSFLILRLADRGAYDTVGLYLVLDKEEAPDITQKRMINIVSILNDRTEEASYIGDLTGTRLLYSMVPEASETEDNVKIIFRTHDGRGVSRENAVLTIEKGVFKNASGTRH